MAMRRMTDYVSDRTELMGRMMRRCGVDVEAACGHLLGTAMYHATRACLFCGNTDQCRQWLDAGEADGGNRAFCANAVLFERFARGDLGGRAAAR